MRKLIIPFLSFFVYLFPLFSLASPKVAIIGAGPAGLLQISAFKAAEARGEQIPEITVFEKQSEYGGLWNYTWKTGLDETGEPVHSGMYKGLMSNAPKECHELPDYSYEEHFGEVLPSFPERRIVRDYLVGYFNSKVNDQCIRYNTIVKNISYRENGKFLITSCNQLTSQTSFEEYDNVIVATGHFSSPNYPESHVLRELDKFSGRILHSRDFRDGKEFSGLNVLVIGTSYSAEDIGYQCHKNGAQSITVGYRNNPTGLNWPNDWSEHKIPFTIEGATVTFEDGISKEIDAIILCTGYKHYFPFIEDNIRLETGNRWWIEKLYKGVALIDNPKIFYLGMQNQAYSFPMFSTQSWYVRDVIMNKISIPGNRQEMLEEDNHWKIRESDIKSPFDAISFQGDYLKELLNYTDHPRINIDRINEIFFEWVNNKVEDVMTFRNKSHRSSVTGNQSAIPNI
jgi:trimethylamine monooxygenase